MVIASFAVTKHKYHGWRIKIFRSNHHFDPDRFDRCDIDLAG
jgi:hypothetical protein